MIILYALNRWSRRRRASLMPCKLNAGSLGSSFLLQNLEYATKRVQPCCCRVGLWNRRDPPPAILLLLLLQGGDALPGGAVVEG